MTQTLDLRRMIYTSMIAALIIIGAYISIPLPFSPVPIAMSNLFVILGGLLLGKKWGFTSVAIYLFLGIIGLPVFAGGKGGLAHFIGPTGGYLIGFAVAAFIVGAIVEMGKHSILKDSLAVLIGFTIIFAFGVPWLMYTLKLSLGETLTAGVIPFIPGAIFKSIVVVGLAKIIRPLIHTSLKANSL